MIVKETVNMFFQQTKALISKEVTLVCLNPTTQFNASKRCLGAVLALTFMTLISAEQRYANIEHKMLAVVFVLETIPSRNYVKRTYQQHNHRYS